MDSSNQHRPLRSACLLLATALVAACPSGKTPPAEVEMVAIPAGAFTLGSTILACGDASSSDVERCDSGNANDDPLVWLDKLSWAVPASASVEAFSLDMEEVSNAHYAVCVDDGACTPPAFSEIEGVAYYGNPAYDAHPVVYVSWDQARAYCAYRGKRLPTEAEWERAARLDKQGASRTYPWSGALEANCNQAGRYAASTLCKGVMVPPALNYSSFDRTDLGLRNMASNVSEWVEDAWDPRAYCEGGAYYPESCQRQGESCAACKADGVACAKSCRPEELVICKAGTYTPRREPNASAHVLRGGSYRHGRCFHRLYVRQRGNAAGREIGFRCAR